MYVRLIAVYSANYSVQASHNLNVSQATDFNKVVKVIVRYKMKTLSSFAHPQVAPNLYNLVPSVEHKTIK